MDTDDIGCRSDPCLPSPGGAGGPDDFVLFCIGFVDEEGEPLVAAGAGGNSKRHDSQSGVTDIECGCFGISPATDPSVLSVSFPGWSGVEEKDRDWINQAGSSGGLGHDSGWQKEVIDFSIAHGESQAAWDAFLSDLYKRGLRAEGMELIVTDGGKGLLAALPFVYPGILVQRCWAHKTRNVLNHIRKADQETAKKDLAAVSNAEGIKQVRTALKRFACTWEAPYPKALASLRECEEELLAFFQIKDRNPWKKIGTTNLIERRFQELIVYR